MAQYLVARTENTTNVKRKQQNSDILNQHSYSSEEKKKKNMYNWSTCVWTRAITWTARCNVVSQFVKNISTVLGMTSLETTGSVEFHCISLLLL